MATPEIRFKGFQGEWSEKQLEEVANRVTKKNTDNAISETFTNSAVQGIVSQLDFFTNSVSNQANISGYYVVSPEDFVYNPRISQKAPYGPINRNKNGRTGVISPLYSVFSINGLNHRFSEWFFKSSRWHDFMRQNGDTGARHDRFSIGSDEFFKMPISIPNADEQKEIGAYLESLENSCVASASAVQKIKLLKQSMLVKMFPQNGMSVPEVRFEGFTGDWEPLLLEDYATFTKGHGYSKNDLRPAGNPIILYGRLYTAFQTEISEINTFSDLRDDSVISRGNEVIVPGSGESAEDISRAAAVIKPGIILGGDLNIIRPNDRIDTVFLALSISNGQAYNELVMKAQGNVIVHLKNDDIKTVELLTPIKEEQAAIGSYFRQLDKLIELEEAKLAKLTQLKTAFLSKMFV